MNGHGSDYKNSVPTGPRALRNGEIPTGPAAMRAASKHGSEMPPPTTKGVDKSGNKRRTSEEAEAALIRQRYMGAEQNQSTFSAKKKRRRTTEKKFNFEWNAEEDTSPDYNPLYQSRAEANFFGRGRLGGFGDDIVDSGTRKYIQALTERDPEAGARRAREILEMERRRKEIDRGAIDKHWREKNLDQMRERDWSTLR